MNKPMISEALSKSINDNSKLVSEQVARISKISQPKLPAFTAPKFGTLTLGNTATCMVAFLLPDTRGLIIVSIRVIKE